MLSNVIAPGLLLLVTALSSVDSLEEISKCNCTVIDQIREFYYKHGYPYSIADVFTDWTIVAYSEQMPTTTCFKQVVGDLNVTSIVQNADTNAVLYTSVVTFPQDVQKGMTKQTILETGKKLVMFTIASYCHINVFYFCAPNGKSNTTSHPQGGVAVPVGLDQDERSMKEVDKMKKFMNKLGIKLYDITACKE